MVRDAAAVRLAGAGAAHQGPGRDADRGGCARFGAVPVEVPTIAVEPPRTPQQMDARSRPGRGPLRVDRVHLRQRGQARCARSSRSTVSTPARSPASRSPASASKTAAAIARLGYPPRPGAHGGEQSSEGLLADFPPYDEVLDPIDRVLLPAGRHRDRDPRRRADRARLGDRRRHGLPHRARRPAARRGPRGDQDRRRSTRSCFTSSSTVRNLVGHRRQAARPTVVARDRPGHRRDRRGARPARRRAGPTSPRSPALVEGRWRRSRRLRAERRAAPAAKAPSAVRRQ